MNTKPSSERKGHDIREDEEQGVKLQEIVDLLVAAGYFRARIKGLSPFDKVVGGMVWCMESCSFDVDVDLLFQENSTIGQKIALTEKIVVFLPKMGCPHRIEPHQIQGLDFIHIFPVIQWLVKQSVEVREERREFWRYSALQEYRRNALPVDQEKEKIFANVDALKEKYRPRRILKRKGTFPTDEVEQVESTLMEYGMSSYNQSSDADSENLPLSSESFVETGESDQIRHGRAVEAVLSAQGAVIATLSDQLGSVEIQEDPLERLRKHKEALLQEKLSIEREINDQTNHLSKIRSTLQNIREDHSQVEHNASAYRELEELVMMDESLKTQEQQFRAHCEEELVRLKGLLEEVSERFSTEMEDVESSCETERSRITNLRLQIARKTRAIAQIKRRLDEVPGRAELAQYQRRFLELYSLVAQKHAETKQFYTFYNTLDDKRLYLAKEVDVLNSVLDTYSAAMSNSLDKTKFIQQFEAIVTAIKGHKTKVEARRDEERRKKDLLSGQLQELMDQQRRYVAVVKQFKLEVKRNETLLAELKSLK